MSKLEFLKSMRLQVPKLSFQKIKTEPLVISCSFPVCLFLVFLSSLGSGEGTQGRRLEKGFFGS
uniref:Uncharacterized protein n=1 Tax=Helianthus annuus TaxID=4232 RepID=A0A251SDE8_HELAN